MGRFFGLDGEPFRVYFFKLGHGCLQRPDPVTQPFFTHRSVIIGHMEIEEIVQNKGHLPLLTTPDGEPAEWQIKPDRWVAVCRPPVHRLEEKIYHSGFRGWGYFDLAANSVTLDSKIRL